MSRVCWGPWGGGRWHGDWRRPRRSSGTCCLCGWPYYVPARMLSEHGSAAGRARCRQERLLAAGRSSEVGGCRGGRAARCSPKGCAAVPQGDERDAGCRLKACMHACKRGRWATPAGRAGGFRRRAAAARQTQACMQPPSATRKMGRSRRTACATVACAMQKQAAGRMEVEPSTSTHPTAGPRVESVRSRRGSAPRCRQPR